MNCIPFYLDIIPEEQRKKEALKEIKAIFRKAVPAFSEIIRRAFDVKIANDKFEFFTQEGEVIHLDINAIFQPLGYCLGVLKSCEKQQGGKENEYPELRRKR